MSSIKKTLSIFNNKMPKKIENFFFVQKSKGLQKDLECLDLVLQVTPFEYNWTLLVISNEPKIWVFWDQTFMACITFGVFVGKSYGLTTCLLTKLQDGEEF